MRLTLPPAGSRLWWALAALALAGQLYGLYNPKPDPAPSGMEGLPLDKLVHFAMFALPVLFFAAAGVRPRVLLAVFAIHACLSEVIQGVFLPHRDGSLADAIADLLGVIAGLAIARTARRSCLKLPVPASGSQG